MKANETLRREMRTLNVPFWALAQAWGCNETTAVKRFRTELPAETQEKVLELIRRAAKSMEG